MNKNADSAKMFYTKDKNRKKGIGETTKQAVLLQNNMVYFSGRQRSPKDSFAFCFPGGAAMPYGVGFLKNKYVGRSFIAPSQDMRETAVKIKLNVIAETVRGKRVVLIDDSIVRGTTSERIVRLLRDAGAAEVHMRISSPPFRCPCFFGTDVDSRENLIACRLQTVEEIAAEIGADSLAYLSVDAAHRLAGGTGRSFCDGCFTGRYPIGIPENQGKSKFEQPIPESDA
jgi:amidophosphoribosyltransferase